MCSGVQWTARKPLWLKLTKWVNPTSRGTSRGQDTQGLQRMVWALNFILSVTGTCWRVLSMGLVKASICSEKKKYQWQLGEEQEIAELCSQERETNPVISCRRGFGSKHHQKEKWGGIKDHKLPKRFSSLLCHLEMLWLSSSVYQRSHLVQGIPRGRNNLISPPPSPCACATLLNTWGNRHFDFPGSPSFWQNFLRGRGGRRTSHGTLKYRV